MSMKIHLEFDETDLYNTLKSMINHPNAEEITKLLTPFIGSSSDCSKWLFKLILGRKLPDIIPVGTICLTHVNNLSYEIDKPKTIESELSDNNGMIACTIKEFRGFHDWRHYEVESLGIDDKGIQKTFSSYLMADTLEIMEEF
jgi:hypothetical protein